MVDTKSGWGVLGSWFGKKFSCNSIMPISILSCNYCVALVTLSIKEGWFLRLYVQFGITRNEKSTPRNKDSIWGRAPTVCHCSILSFPKSPEGNILSNQSELVGRINYVERVGAWKVCRFWIWAHIWVSKSDQLDLVGSDTRWCHKAFVMSSSALYRLNYFKVYSTYGGIVLMNGKVLDLILAKITLSVISKVQLTA